MKLQWICYTLTSNYYVGTMFNTMFFFLFPFIRIMYSIVLNLNKVNTFGSMIHAKANLFPFGSTIFGLYYKHAREACHSLNTFKLLVFLCLSFLICVCHSDASFVFYVCTCIQICVHMLLYCLFAFYSKLAV